MSYSQKETQDALAAVTLAIQNAQNMPDVLTLLAQEGYTSTALQQGQDLANKLSSSLSSSASALGEQLDSTQAVKEAQKSAQAALSLFRKKARTVFAGAGNEASRRLLLLDQPVPAATNGQITHGKSTFQAALGEPAMVESLTANAYSSERLKELLSQFESLEALNAAQEQRKGEKQQAVQTRKAESQAFMRWWHGFRSTARLILTPQQLTALGLA